MSVALLCERLHGCSILQYFKNSIAVIKRANNLSTKPLIYHLQHIILSKDSKKYSKYEAEQQEIISQPVHERPVLVNS